MREFSRIFNFLFFLLTLILVSDLNGSLSILLNTRGVLSELILIITLVLFVKSFQIKTRVSGLTKHYILFYLFYLIYGTLLYYLMGSDIGNPINRIRSLTPSIILLYTYSKWFHYYITYNYYDKVINIISVSLIINSVLIIYSSRSGGIFTSDGFIDRSSGLIASVNQAGITTSLTQVFMLFRATDETMKKHRRAVFLVFYFVALIAAILTFSKAAMLTSVIILIIFLYVNVIRVVKIKQFRLQIPRFNRFLYFFLFVFILIVAVYGTTFISQFSAEQSKRLELFSRLLTGDVNDQTTTNRISLARYAVEQIKNDQFMGRGLDTFHRMEGRGLGPHNQFLLILGEVGILGLLIFISYFISLFFKINKAEDSLQLFLLLSIFFVLCVAAVVSHTLLFVKTYVIMFAFLNVIAQYNQQIQTDKTFEE